MNGERRYVIKGKVIGADGEEASTMVVYDHGTLSSCPSIRLFLILYGLLSCLDIFNLATPGGGAVAGTPSGCLKFNGSLFTVSFEIEQTINLVGRDFLACGFIQTQA